MDELTANCELIGSLFEKSICAYIRNSDMGLLRIIGTLAGESENFFRIKDATVHFQQMVVDTPIVYANKSYLQLIYERGGK